MNENFECSKNLVPPSISPSYKKFFFLQEILFLMKDLDEGVQKMQK